MWKSGRKSTSGNVGIVGLLLSVIVVGLAAWIIIVTHPAKVQSRPNWNYPQTLGR
jgi:hypothetical protein